MLPNLGEARLAHAVKIASEFASDWDGIIGDHSSGASGLVEPNTRVVTSLGSSMTALEIISAEKIRRYLFDYMNAKVWSTVDMIATPTTSITAPAIQSNVLKFGESNTPLSVELLKYVFLGNFLGLPGISVPVGADESNMNMPVGFQLIGKHWGEDEILRVARAVEDTHQTSPPSDSAVL